MTEGELEVDHGIKVIEAIGEITAYDVNGAVLVEGLRAHGYRIVPADWWDSCLTCDSINKGQRNCLFCDPPHATPATEPSACTDNWHTEQ